MRGGGAIVPGSVVPCWAEAGAAIGGGGVVAWPLAPPATVAGAGEPTVVRSGSSPWNASAPTSDRARGNQLRRRGERRCPDARGGADLRRGARGGSGGTGRGRDAAGAPARDGTGSRPGAPTGRAGTPG